MSEIRSLQPTTLWNHFADINAIPRASKKEEKIMDFVFQFGKRLGLETRKDKSGNVIIVKPATKGMESRKKVILQGHLDMVHQKNSGTAFDFEKEGIRMKMDGDWVKAEGTTLGADNGIGSAAIMAVLSSKDIQHPPLEALFTVDEESGMSGAIGLSKGEISGDILLNLDSENDSELCIGCAGGVDVTAEGKYETQKTRKESRAYKLTVKGLTGGHSGIDIHLGRANANKIISRILLDILPATRTEIHHIEGGSLRNVIPREAEAVFSIDLKSDGNLRRRVEELTAIIRAEYDRTDPDMMIALNEHDSSETSMDQDFAKTFLSILHTCPSGIHRMSPTVKELVQTSNNLSRVLASGGKYSIQCLTRSSVDSEKNDLASSLSSLFRLMGADVSTGNSYPGWTPNPDASIIKLMRRLYREKFDSEASVNACHAGLECGILGQFYPGMEMISFGPNILAAHSPDERVQISSVQKFWSFLLETLKEIPGK